MADGRLNQHERYRIHALHEAGCSLRTTAVQLDRAPRTISRDQHLWELLAAREDRALVTGDKRLFDAQEMAGRILTPQASVARWQAGV